MPDIKLPYTEEADELLENIEPKVEQVGGEIEYDVTNAPDMRETYQLGGLVPGQPGFGQRPIPRPPVAPVAPISPRPSIPPIMEEGGEVPEYKKGGKVKK